MSPAVSREQNSALPASSTSWPKRVRDHAPRPPCPSRGSAGRRTREPRRASRNPPTHHPHEPALTCPPRALSALPRAVGRPRRHEAIRSDGFETPGAKGHLHHNDTVTVCMGNERGGDQRLRLPSLGVFCVSRRGYRVRPVFPLCFLSVSRGREVKRRMRKKGGEESLFWGILSVLFWMRSQRLALFPSAVEGPGYHSPQVENIPSWREEAEGNLVRRRESQHSWN